MLGQRRGGARFPCGTNARTLSDSALERGGKRGVPFLDDDFGEFGDLLFHSSDVGLDVDALGKESSEVSPIKLTGETEGGRTSFLSGMTTLLFTVFASSECSSATLLLLSLIWARRSAHPVQPPGAGGELDRERFRTPERPVLNTDPTNGRNKLDSAKGVCIIEAEESFRSVAAWVRCAFAIPARRGSG